MHNLLVEPLIRYRQSHAEMHEASLPEIFEALIADTVETFPALRPHQHHAWHAFLVQLAAAAITAEPSAKRPADEAEWAEALRRLTPDSPDDEAWHLSNTDLTRPAFMQPPANAADRIEDYRDTIDTPDELDLLVTTRNHSIKRKIARNGRPEDWLFALISIQTMEGYAGRDNYGISRMTSGYGNRPSLSLSPSAKPGRQFTRDLDALLELRTARAQQLFPKRPVLLWTLPWHGTPDERLALEDLDPHYIEVCRRVRLEAKDGTITARRATSKSRRIHDVQGQTGDPWTPTSPTTKKDGAPPSYLGPAGFSAKRLMDALTGTEWEKPPFITAADGADAVLIARGMVRGEGGTAGYQEKKIPLGAATLRALATGDGEAMLTETAAARLEDLRIFRRAVYNATVVLAANGGDPTESERGIANAWAQRYAQAAEGTFFQELEEELQADADDRPDIRHRWGTEAAATALQVVREAAAGVPGTRVTKATAPVLAERSLLRQLHGPRGPASLKIGAPEKERQN